MLSAVSRRLPPLLVAMAPPVTRMAVATTALGTTWPSLLRLASSSANPRGLLLANPVLAARARRTLAGSDSPLKTATEGSHSGAAGAHEDEAGGEGGGAAAAAAGENGIANSIQKDSKSPQDLDQGAPTSRPLFSNGG